MKKSITIYLITLLALTLVFGQSSDRIQREMVSLRTKIVQMQQLATRYHATQIEEGLQLALVKLNKARELLLASPHKIKEAMALYKEARHLAEVAGRLLSLKPALKVIAELDRSIQKSEHAVEGKDNAEARYLLNRARNFRQRAVTAYEQAQFEKAQEFYRIGLYFSNKAYQIVYGNAQSDTGAMRYQRVMTNLNNLYQDLAAQKSNPNLVILIENAAGALQEARKAYQQGNITKAMVQLQISERLLFRAADLSEQSGDGLQRNVENNLRSLERYISGIENAIHADATPSQRQLLRKARNFMRAAERDLSRSQITKAQSKIALAQRMATRALPRTAAKEAPNSARLEKRLNELEQLLQMQAAAENINVQRMAKILHPAALNYLKQARADLAAGQAQRAKLKISFVLRLLNRIDAASAAERSNSPYSRSDLQERFDQLSNLLNRIKNEDDQSAAMQFILPQLENLLQQVPPLLEQDETWTAQQLLRFVRRQLNQLVRTGAGS